MGWFSDIIDTVVEVGKGIYDWLVGKVEEIEKEVDKDFGTCPVNNPTQPCPGPQHPPKLGGLAVQVLRQDDEKPIAGADVQVSGPETRNGVTDASGIASFEPLLVGHYVVEVVAQGYDPNQTNGTVIENTTQQVKVKLKSAKAVNPKITPENGINVLVKKPDTKPARRMVVLTVDEQMTGGTGTLVASPADKVKFFDAATGGNEVAAGTVFPHTKINPGITLYVEGAAASGKKDDVEIKFSVSPATQPAGPPAKATGTAVEVTLDICLPRHEKGKDPNPIEEAKKNSEGRFLHEQDAAKSQARARLILRRAKPKDFDGVLQVDPIDGKVALFGAETGAAPAVNIIKNTDIDEKKGHLLFAEGKFRSAALRDTGARAGLAGIDMEGDKVAATVFSIAKIEAELDATPKKRDGTSKTQPKKSSTGNSKTFDATTIVLVRGCGDVKLKADVSPAGVKLAWAAERAADDPASLTGEPALQADGADTTKQILKTDADVAGSFHISAYVDETGNGKREEEEGGGRLNVHLVKIEVPTGAANNKVITRADKYTNTRSTAGALVVDSGSTGGIAPGVNALYTDAEFTKHPYCVKVTVKLIGGGADKRRGTDKVRLGYIQTTTADSVVGTYADGRTLKELIVVNAATADPIVGGTPAALGFPVRDTRGGASTNSGPYIISSSDADKTNLASGGLQRICRFVDPPAIVLDMTHPVTGSALASIAGTNDFAVYLSAYSEDFDANYTVVAEGTWSAHYGTYTPAGGWTTAGAQVTTSGAALTVHNPPRRGVDTGAERFPPNFVDNLKMDAR